MLLLHRRLLAFLSAALLVAGLGACDDDDNPLGPEDVSRADVIGTFDATTFTVAEPGVAPVNLLGVGADIEITLNQAGMTTGRLFIPGADEDGSALEEDLAGTFVFDEDTRQLTFDQDADTFLRDVTFTGVRSGDTILLEGTETFGGTTVSVVLTRR